MFKINSNVNNLLGLKNRLDKIEVLIEKQKGDFNNYLKQKVWETLEKVMESRFSSNTTSNDDDIELYKSSNHIVDTENGFILYNDAKIDVSDAIAENYPSGEFSIALAFEYGVGLVGAGNYNGKYFEPWEYNVNNYNFGWFHDGKTYAGYNGYEIYRYVADIVMKDCARWFLEYDELIKIPT